MQRQVLSSNQRLLTCFAAHGKRSTRCGDVYISECTSQQDGFLPSDHIAIKAHCACFRLEVKLESQGYHIPGDWILSCLEIGPCMKLNKRPCGPIFAPCVLSRLSSFDAAMAYIKPSAKAMTRNSCQRLRKHEQWTTDNDCTCVNEIRLSTL